MENEPSRMHYETFWNIKGNSKNKDESINVYKTTIKCKERQINYNNELTLLPFCAKVKSITKIDFINYCLIGNPRRDASIVRRATQWAFADGLGVNPMADPETIDLAVLIFRQSGEAITLSRYPKRYYSPGTWRTLHPRLILHAPGALNLHDGL